MRYKLVLAALFAASMGSPSSSGQFNCAAEDPSEDFLRAVSLMHKDELSSNKVHIRGRYSTKRQETTAQSNVTVDTYFHVVSSSTEDYDGNVPDSMLMQQLIAMNDAYAPYSIQFSLVDIDRTVNATWAMDGDPMAMRKALRRGTYSSLNVYFEKSLGAGALGYCYLPITTGVSINSTDFYRDGCAVLYSTVPGGASINSDKGLTAVHEVGHWFGLLHTFQGNSCSSSNKGDLIADTPLQANASSGCPIGRDSCPDDDGLDPIHNYMDYSNDACYTEFTAGQVTRMHSMYSKYRAGQ